MAPDPRNDTPRARRRPADTVRPPKRHLREVRSGGRCSIQERDLERVAGQRHRQQEAFSALQEVVTAEAGDIREEIRGHAVVVPFATRSKPSRALRLLPELIWKASKELVNEVAGRVSYRHGIVAFSEEDVVASGAWHFCLLFVLEQRQASRWEPGSPD